MYPVGNVYGVILAGGSGTRLGSPTPKQFLSLGGVPIFIRSVRTLLSEPRVKEVWIERRLARTCRCAGAGILRRRSAHPPV